VHHVLKGTGERPAPRPPSAVLRLSRDWFTTPDSGSCVHQDLGAGSRKGFRASALH